MKKVALLSLLFAGLIQANTFFGVDIGYIMYGSSTSGATNSTIYNTAYKGRLNINGITLSANYGAEGFVNSVLGGRIFLEGLYSHGLNNNNKTIDLTGNADVMLNVIDPLGVFGGLGFGYEYSIGKTFKDGNGYLPLYGRLGATIALGQGRIDVTFKLPIMGWRIHGKSPFVNSPFSVQVGYKHSF